MKADADAMILRKTDLGWRYEMEKVDKPIRLIFAGDLCPDARNQELSSDHYKSFYQPFHDILHDKDYSVVNLECPLTNHPAPLAKVGPVLQAERRMIDLIKTGGFDAVCLANNHIMDQGAGGLEDTLTVCKESMISTVGAESDYNRARQILVKNINDVRIAFYNVCEQEFSISGLDRPGANPFDPVDCFHDIRKALQEVDLVIVIYHGGIEQANLPGPGLVKVFHYFAELGAAAVIGHHSHYPGGFELYRGVPLFYSLGNFILDRQDQKRDWYRGFFVRLEFKQRNFSALEIFPYQQSYPGTGLSRLPEEEETELITRVLGFSQVIADKTLLAESWQGLVRARSTDYLVALLGAGRLRKQFIRKGHCTSSARKLRKILNLIRCDSHREITLAVLQELLTRKKR